jgi:hypothetical protein
MTSESQPTQDTQVLETKRKKDAFQKLFQETLRKKEEGVPVVEYKLPYPKEDYLKFLVEEECVLLHGSANRDIETVEPRKANDSSKASGNKTAIYGVVDPVLPIFYAIQDRSKFRDAVVKSGVSQNVETGELEYKFEIPMKALEAKPWIRGVIYLFDRSQFKEEKDDTGELSGEWTSESPIRPLAKLEVGPEDFRFLNNVEGF